MLVCGFDLRDEKNPAARQLKNSILHYMSSDDFNPSYEKDIASLQKMLTYVEPLKSTVTGEFSNALLYIDCAAQDKTFANKKTTYEITPEWQAKEMELTIQCPPGIIGSLYVCFVDKDKKGRTGHLVFEGRDYELVKQENEESWVKLHIMREDSNDGILRLKAKLKNGPDLVISKVAIVEE